MTSGLFIHLAFVCHFTKCTLKFTQFHIPDYLAKAETTTVLSFSQQNGLVLFVLFVLFSFVFLLLLKSPISQTRT